MSLPQWVQDTRQSVVIHPPPEKAGTPHEMAAVPAPPRKLDFVLEPQKYRFWCWAAVSVSIARFYDKSTAWTQCELAAKALGQNDCCGGKHSEDCDERHDLVKALERVGHLNPKSLGIIPLSDDQGGPSFKGELDANRPVALYIKTEVGHYIAAYGYDLSDGHRAVEVADPSQESSTESTWNFDVFLKGYHGWPWTQTIFTR